MWTFARFVRPLLATILCVWEIWFGSNNRVYIFYRLAKKIPPPKKKKKKKRKGEKARHRIDFEADLETGDLFIWPNSKIWFSFTFNFQFNNTTTEAYSSFDDNNNVYGEMWTSIAWSADRAATRVNLQNSLQTKSTCSLKKPLLEFMLSFRYHTNNGTHGGRSLRVSRVVWVFFNPLFLKWDFNEESPNAIRVRPPIECCMSAKYSYQSSSRQLLD